MTIRPSSDHEMLKDLWDKFHEPAFQHRMKELEQAIEEQRPQQMKQGDAVTIRGKIVKLDGNFATVSVTATDFVIVPLSAVKKATR